MLDNFETNLKPLAEPPTAAGQSVWACQDPAWDRCLASLAQELAGSPSRVLITSRRPLAALADVSATRSGSARCRTEAALYLKAHPALGKMVFAPMPGKRRSPYASNASRFHPLLMDRLARLAADQKLRDQLLQALDTLEKTKDFAQLPALFATTPGDAKELAYLERRPRRLARPTHPRCQPGRPPPAVDNCRGQRAGGAGTAEGVWSGKTRATATPADQADARQAAAAPDGDAGKAERHDAGAPRRLDALPPEPPARPEIEPLLRHLVSVGLATEERTGPEDDNPDLTCHELVRERIRAWMEQQPQDRGELTENAIRLAYAERLEAVFTRSSTRT